jgi:anti-anti-sigma regulatory factor
LVRASLLQATMLRITIHDEPGSRTFQLEGKLAGPWLRELEDCWRSQMAGQHSPILRFDLTGVTYIDAAGKEFLAARHTDGAEFLACGCVMRAVVAEIRDTSASPGTNSSPRER